MNKGGGRTIFPSRFRGESGGAHIVLSPTDKELRAIRSAHAVNAAATAKALKGLRKKK